MESYILIGAYRVIEGVLEQLVTWAAAALEKSSNQPVLPHAIIVLNATPNDTDPEFWNVSSATARLLESLSQTVSQNATFKRYALFWRERSRNIRTVEELLLSYYSSVRVVRIPTTGRPNLINEQVQELYKGIGNACASSRKRRSELRMLLDAVSKFSERHHPLEQILTPELFRKSSNPIFNLLLTILHVISIHRSTLFRHHLRTARYHSTLGGTY